MKPPLDTEDPFAYASAMQLGMSVDHLQKLQSQHDKLEGYAQGFKDGKSGLRRVMPFLLGYSAGIFTVFIVLAVMA